MPVREMENSNGQANDNVWDHISLGAWNKTGSTSYCTHWCNQLQSLIQSNCWKLWHVTGKC